MIKRFYILLLAIVASVGVSYALNPRSGDTWDDNTKTLTVNSNPQDDRYNDQSEIKRLVISSSVTEIGEQAFSNNYNLREVIAYDGLQVIDQSAFFYCPNLESVILPSTLREVRYSVFAACDNLKYVTINASSLEDYAEYAFDDTHADLKIYVPEASVATYKTFWPAYADKFQAIPSSLAVGDTLKVGDAMYSATGVYVDAGYLRFQIKASSLHTISVIEPNGNGKIKVEFTPYAEEFYPSGSYAALTNWFYCYSEYTSGDVTAITVVSGAGTLADPFVIDYVQPAAPAPANSCGDGLTWELNGGVLTISYDGVGTGEMYDFGYEYDANPVNVAPWKENKSEITTVVIGDGVKSIGNYAFNDLYENFTAVTIANSVERIGLNAFMNAKWITEITLPSSLKTIDKECFAANFGFTSITIPSGVTSIGNKAFSYCNGLTSLTCEATTPPTLGSSVFYKIRSKTSDISSIPLYVPSESVAAYEAAAQWNAFDVQAITGGGSTPANSCGDGLIWELNDGALTISYTGTGTGVMDNYASASDAPWYSHKDDITSVTITDGVKSVGSYSFGYYGNLVTVTIGNDVETIGEYAFGDCYKFTTLNLGNSVKHIGNRAFMWAKVLTGFTLPSTLETIGEYAFLQNKLITSLTIPSNVTSIGPSAFMYCAALTSVTVEATTPPTLGATVFEGVPTSSIPLHVPSGSVAAYTAADQWNAFDIQDPTPAYEKVMNLINEIPNPAVLTAECKAKIDAARAAFIALSDGDKDLVTNIATLTTAEAAFDNVMDIWLSGDCDVILWSDTTLTVRKHAGEGNGAMADYNYASRAPWYSSHWYDPKPNDIVIKSVTIEEGVTHLGDYAFAWMSEMKTVTIPSSVTTIPEDAFYWSKAVDDIYLHTNPSDLMWVLPTSADNQFKPEKATLCHVPVDLLPVYQGWLNGLNVTYVGDQTPTIPTLEVGLTLNAMDVFYLGPDTTCFQFNCFSSNKYFFGKGSFRINFESPAENVHTMHFVPKQQGTDVLMMYRDGETFVTYGTNCCATALPTSATVTAGDGTKANPFVLEPDTKGECVQAEMTTLPQAVSEITYDGEPHTLVAAGVSNYGTVQYSLDNGASWSAELPQGTDPVTYTVHYRVIGGNACVQGIDYDPNNKVTASIVAPAVENVEAKIAAIPQPVVYTPACEEAIADARSAYDALDDNLKPFVENYDVLTAAETTYANLKDIAVVEAKINNIPTSVELKLATRDSIESARAAYDALNADQKPLVSNYQTLLDAEAALAALNPGGSVPMDIVWDGNTGIENVDPNTTSPAYEGMTVTVGNGSSFSTYQSRLYFTFYSQPNGGFIFANADGSNITKVVIESTTALTSTMTEVDRMGSGWVISNENKTATWTGNADSVSIWEGQSFTNYWVVDKITFTVNGVGATPLDSAQAVKDLIDAIPVPVTLDSKDEIDAARDAYDALADLTKGALDNATVKKLTDAEDAYAALIKEATDVIALINAIPQPVVYNEACGDSIIAARNAYDALSDELKPLVTNYPVLTDAEATYEALAPRIWTSGDCQVIYWPGDSAMIVSKLPGEGNGVMDNYANKNSVPWVDYQLKVKTLTIESGVTEIGSCAFYELRNLEGGLVIPEGVTAIHENGFRNCLKLTSITLPSTITLLGDDADAFNNCKAANISITADPNKLAWNEDFDDFIYSYSQQDVHKTTVCHVPVDFYEIYVAKFDQTVNVTFVGDLPAALSPAEHAAIEAVKDSIAAIGAEITYPESGAAIDAARSAYDALDDDLKPFVSNYQTLLDAEDAYADAKQAHDAVAAAVVDKINAIPVPVEYSSKAAIDTARVAYDALLDTQKALITPEQLKVLTDAEATWAAIAEKVEHNVSYMGKDGELKNEKVALLHIPDPAPDFNGYEFVRWDVKAGDFLEEGLRVKAVYTPIITTNPQGFDTLAYNGLAQELVKAGEAKEGHIEYSLYPEESESWSAELPKATNAGVYAIYYKLVREGHADYIAPEPTMATIAKVPVTYVAPTAYDTLVYTASNQTLIAAGQTQDGTFEYSLDPTLLDSWKAELLQAKDAGTYSVYYRVKGDINHLDSTAVDPIAVTIAKAPLTATADDKSIIYGDLAPEFTVTYAGWQGDDDATVLTGEIAYACEYVKGNPVGEYVITPSGVDAANYTIEFVNGKLTVNSKSAKSDDITAKQADNEMLVYDAAANKPTIQAKDTTKTLVEDTDYKLTFIGRGDTEYAESATAPAHVGEYTAIVAFIGNYTDTLTVDFVINKAPLTITADDKEVTFGEFAPEFTVSYEGWQGNDTATVLTGSQAYACEYVRGNQIGDYTIIPSGVDAHDYAITFVNGTLTVNRKSAKSADIAAKQADNEKLVYDAEANRPTIQVKDTTLVLTEAQDYVLTFMGVAADQTPYAESETAPTHVGNYTAIVAFIGNYIDTLTVDFTINKAPLTITANDTAMIYGDVAPAFTVSYNGWFGNDDESVILGTQAYDCVYAPGSPIGTYAITPKDVDAYDYAITFVDGTLTVNKAHVYVSGAEAQIAKFADGHANAVVLEQGVLNGIKLNDPIAHVTTAAFSSADVAENLTITLFYELTGDAALLNNYNLDPTSDIFTTEGVIIEPFIPDNEEKPEDEEAKVNEGIEIYAYGYCDGSGYSLKYHLESGNPDQYKIDFEDSRFTDVDWTNLVITGKDGTIDIEIPVDLPTGDYTMTVYFRDSRFDWLESRQFNVTFHVNLPETYVRPLFDNVIALVDTCHCLTDIQWYWRANSTELWQPIEGANGYYYHVDGKLTGEYFVSAKMNGEPTYTCGQADMETLYGAGQQLEAPVVRAYPNPVVNSTTVTIENSIEWIHNIRIVNLMGVEVMNDTFEGDKTSVEMGNYPQGNYMISVDGIVVKVMKK